MAPTKTDIENGETTPLLPSANGNQNNNNNDEPVLEDMQSESIKEKAVAGVAGISFISSILSMILETTIQHPSVFISAILGIVLAPYAAFQQQKITQTEALKQTNEQMEIEVQHLTNENNRLQQQVQELDKTVSNLSVLENTLQTVNQIQGDSIKKLEEQVNESKEILSHMDKNVQGMILQNIISVLLATDADANSILSDDEINILIEKLENLQGVQLKEDLIRRKIIDNGRKVEAVLDVARSVVTADKNSSDNLISFLEEKQSTKK